MAINMVKIGSVMHKIGTKLQSGIHTVAKIGSKIESGASKGLKILDKGLKVASVASLTIPEIAPIVLGAEGVVSGARKILDKNPFRK